MSLRASACALALTALALAACSALDEGPDEARDGGPEVEPTILATGRGDVRADCPPARVARRLVTFLAAFNAGEDGRARRFFAEPAFQWYAVTTGPGTRDFLSNAYDLPTLGAYFRGRHEVGERLTLREVRVNFAHRLDELDGTPIAPTLTAAVELSLRRDAEDMGSQHRRAYGGKALVACNRDRILMWTIGAGAGPTSLCPRPPKPVGRETVLACTAG